MPVKQQQPTLTVAILTYNGQDYLRRILEALRAQAYENPIEVLVIDSGSTDSTLQIISDFPEVRLEQIPNSEFGHGRTRNYAAQIATGEIIAYLTHDAIPMGPKWAEELVAPFAQSERIVAVMGKQVPRPNCFPLLKYEIEGVFGGLGSDLGFTVYELLPEDEANEGLRFAKAFYSDVNSAARRRFLTEVLPYRDVRYAEDQLFGLDLLEAGYLKAYAPGAAVEHSNDLTLEEYGPRIFDETVALREIGRKVLPLSGRSRLRLTVRGIVGDSVRILRDRSFGVKRKAFWLLRNPSYHLIKWKFHNRGARFDLAQSSESSSHSLEGKRKSVATTASASERKRSDANE